MKQQKFIVTLGVSLIVLLLLAGAAFATPAAGSETQSQAALRHPSGNQSSPHRQEPGSPKPQIVVGEVVTPSLSPVLADLPLYQPEYQRDREINPRLSYNRAFDPNYDRPGGLDPLLAVQKTARPAAPNAFGTPILSFNGQGYTGVNPPDTVGDVGPNHYVQMINGSSGAILTVYNKATGAVIAGPTSLDSLGAGACASGNGDPVALYDQAADRWMLSEFASSGNHLCVYISQTASPTGAYYAYDFTTPFFPDYLKYGVWPDAYYVTTNETTPTVYALDRAKMLTGLAATSQRATAPNLAGFGFQSLTPADLDGPTAPPASSPGLFMRHVDTEVHGVSGYPTQDILEVWRFQVDWTTPANSTFAKLADILVSEFDSTLCGLSSLYCMAMPGVAQGSTSSLDPIREVIMNRLAYRNFGDHETLVGNFVTDVNGANQGGVRWFELRKSGAGTWSLLQEGTYSPTGDNRWMGAIAMDRAGNIALGYNVSSGTVYPSLRYTGRLTADTFGTMTQGDNVLVSGTATNGSNRYGDYAAMSVDPSDDCTFWFTGEWNGASTWSTRIGSFKFAECGTPDFTLSTTPATQSICAPASAVYSVTLGSYQGFSNLVTLSASGQPTGTTTGFSVNPLTPPGNSTFTIGNTGAAAAGHYNIDVVGVSATRTHTSTIGLNLYTTVPGVPSLTTPPDGATGVAAPSPVFTWTAVANAVSYDLQVASDAGFTTVVYSTTVAGTSASATGLVSNTTYYWRVRANNTCGVGTYSAPFSFTTSNLVYGTYCATPNLAIPDNNATGVTSTLVITPAGTLIDLNLIITATHTWVGDTSFNLGHGAAGARVIDRPGVPASTFGCSADNIGAQLDDEGVSGPVENQCSAVSPALFGNPTPNNPLSVFDGQTLSGTWSLNASDALNGDTGVLQQWCLVATSTIPTVVYANPSDATCGGNSPCYSGSTAIQQALNGVAPGGQVIVQSSHSVSAALTCAGNVTVSGANGASITWTGGAGDLFTAQNCNLQVKGLILDGGGTATIFDQVGTGMITAYANNISNFAAADAGAGTPQIGHNYWGTSDPIASAPTGMPPAEWPKRLGALRATWAEGASSASLISGTITATLSGGAGTAVIVSHGRGLANAPFGNGVAPFADQGCSDFYDFFTIGGSGAWNVQVPIDNNANCNANTLTPKRVTWITSLAQCTPATNTACWNAIAPISVTVSGQNLVVNGLSVAELGGTPFVAGNINGLDPTALTLHGLAARSNDVRLPIELIALGGLTSAAILWQTRKRRQAR